MGVQLVIRRPSKGVEHAVDLTPLGAELRIGRDSQNDIQIPLPFFSSQHLRIHVRDAQWYAEDLGSTNGTQYLGQRLKPGISAKWDIGIPLVVQDLELTLTQDSSHVTLAHTGSLARRLLVDDVNLDRSDLAFLEVQNGPQSGQRFSLPDHLEKFCFEVTSNGIQEDESGNLTVTRDGDGFAIVTKLEMKSDHKNYLPGSRIRSGTRLRYATVEFLFYDPLEDLLPSPPNPPQTHDVVSVLSPTEPSIEEVERTQKKDLSKTEWLAITIAVVAIVIGLALLFVLFG